MTFGAGENEARRQNPFLQEADEFSVNCRNNCRHRRLPGGNEENCSNSGSLGITVTAVRNFSSSAAHLNLQD